MSVRIDGRQAWRVGLRALLALLVLTLGLLLAFNLWAHRRLAGELEQVARTGDSLDLESFVSALEEGEANASDILDAAGYLRAATASGARPPFDPTRIHLDQSKDLELLVAVEAWLDRPKHRLLLQVIDTGSEIERARYSRGLADRTDLAARWEDYGRLRVTSPAIARLFRQRAFVHLAHGDEAAAIEDVWLILRIANWIGAEQPTILSALLSASVARTGMATLEELLQVATTEKETAAHLAAELDRLRSAGSARTLKAERAFSFHLTRTAHEADLSFLGPGRPLGALIAPGFFNASTAEILQAFDELIRFAEMPPFERPPVDSLIGKRTRNPLKAIARMLTPNFLDGIGKIDELGASSELALVALACEIYQVDHLAYPQTLQELVPAYLDEIPLDPFSGEALRWVRRGDRCLLYSIGRNREDDGGIGKRIADESFEEDDLAWRLPCEVAPQ